MNFKNGWQAGQVLKVQLLPESTSEDWAGKRIQLLSFNNSPEEVEDKVLNERGDIFVFIWAVNALVVVGKPLKDEHDKGKELEKEGQDEGGREDLVELDSIQQVGNVTHGDACPE